MGAGIHQGSILLSLLLVSVSVARGAIDLCPVSAPSKFATKDDVTPCPHGSFRGRDGCQGDPCLSDCPDKLTCNRDLTGKGSCPCVHGVFPAGHCVRCIHGEYPDCYGDGQVRLVADSTARWWLHATAGRVQVHADGVWRDVCDRVPVNFVETEFAKWVCERMGVSGEGALEYHAVPMTGRPVPRWKLFGDPAGDGCAAESAVGVHCPHGFPQSTVAEARQAVSGACYIGSTPWGARYTIVRSGCSDAAKCPEGQYCSHGVCTPCSSGCTDPDCLSTCPDYSALETACARCIAGEEGGCRDCCHQLSHPLSSCPCRAAGRKAGAACGNGAPCVPATYCSSEGRCTPCAVCPDCACESHPSRKAECRERCIDEGVVLCAKTCSEMVPAPSRTCDLTLAAVLPCRTAPPGFTLSHLLRDACPTACRHHPTVRATGPWVWSSLTMSTTSALPGQPIEISGSVTGYCHLSLPCPSASCTVSLHLGSSCVVIHTADSGCKPGEFSRLVAAPSAHGVHSLDVYESFTGGCGGVRRGALGDIHVAPCKWTGVLHVTPLWKGAASGAELRITHRTNGSLVLSQSITSGGTHYFCFPVAVGDFEATVHKFGVTWTLRGAEDAESWIEEGSEVRPPVGGSSVGFTLRTSCPPQQVREGGACRPCAPGEMVRNLTCLPVVCGEDQHVVNHTCVPCLQGKTNPPLDVATGGDTTCSAGSYFTGRGRCLDSRGGYYSYLALNVTSRAQCRQLAVSAKVCGAVGIEYHHEYNHQHAADDEAVERVCVPPGDVPGYLLPNKSCTTVHYCGAVDCALGYTGSAVVRCGEDGRFRFTGCGPMCRLLVVDPSSVTTPNGWSHVVDTGKASSFPTSADRDSSAECYYISEEACPKGVHAGCSPKRRKEIPIRDEAPHGFVERESQWYDIIEVREGERCEEAGYYSIPDEETCAVGACTLAELHVNSLPPDEHGTCHLNCTGRTCDDVFLGSAPCTPRTPCVCLLHRGPRVIQDPQRTCLASLSTSRNEFELVDYGPGCVNGLTDIATAEECREAVCRKAGLFLSSPSLTGSWGSRDGVYGGCSVERTASTGSFVGAWFHPPSLCSDAQCPSPMCVNQSGSCTAARPVRTVCTEAAPCLCKRTPHELQITLHSALPSGNAERWRQGLESHFQASVVLNLTRSCVSSAIDNYSATTRLPFRGHETPHDVVAAWRERLSGVTEVAGVPFDHRLVTYAFLYRTRTAPAPTKVKRAFEGLCPVRGDLWKSGKMRECNPCNATLSSEVACGGVGPRRATVQHTVVLPPHGSRSFVFDALSTSAMATADRDGEEPAEHVVVAKHVLSGNTRVAVSMGGYPMTHTDIAMLPAGWVTPDGVSASLERAAYHCRTDDDGSRSESCILTPCGPFVVTLSNPLPHVSSANLSVCFSGLIPVQTGCACSEPARDGLRHGTCVLSADRGFPAVGCRCDAGFDPGASCKECKDGYFPPPGSDSTHPPCSMRCAFGHYDRSMGVCQCPTNSMTGAECSGPCKDGLHGMFCNETFPPLNFSLSVPFGVSDAPREYPRWVLARNSRVHIYIADRTNRERAAAALKRATLHFKASQAKGDEKERVSLPMSDTITAAFWGERGETRLNVVRKGVLHSYRLSAGVFELAEAVTPLQYLRSVKVESCLVNFSLPLSVICENAGCIIAVQDSVTCRLGTCAADAQCPTPTVPSEVPFPAFATAVASPSLGAPLLVFGEQRLWSADEGERPIASTLPSLGLPARLMVVDGPGRAAVRSSVLGALNYTVALCDDHGVVVPLPAGDVIEVQLLRCPGYFNRDEEEAIATLSAQRLAALGDPGIRSPQSCQGVSDGRLIGEDAGGVWGPAGGEAWYPAFGSLGIIAPPGHYALRFVHPRSGVSVVTEGVKVESTPCHDRGLFAQEHECHVDCTADLLTEAGCAADVGPYRETVQLVLEAEGISSLDVGVAVVQPCCSGNGLCCEGGLPCDVPQQGGGRGEGITCTCHSSNVHGFWDEGTGCTTCRLGFTGRTCGVFDGPVSVVSTGKSGVREGDTHFHSIPVEGGTKVRAALDVRKGDVDFSMAYIPCPTARTDVRGARCSGHGECSLDMTRVAAQCSCHPGHYTDDCSGSCCSGHGMCNKATGDECRCMANDKYGRWARHRNVVARKVQASEATYILPDDPSTNRQHHRDAALMGYPGHPMIAWVSWRGLKPFSRNAVDTAIIHLHEASHPGGCGALEYERACLSEAGCLWENGTCLPCTAPLRVYVYATEPSGSTPFACTNSTDPSREVCGAAVPKGRTPCPPSSAYSPHTGRCECIEPLSCMSGLCSIPESCLCRSSQSANDALDEETCDEGTCSTPLRTLHYSWEASKVDSRTAALFFNWSSSDCHTPPEPELLWSGALPSPWMSASRFPYEVTSFWQTRKGHQGTVREIDIAPWMNRYLKHLAPSRGGSPTTFDLSFAIVTMPVNTSQCQPAFLLHGTDRPALTLVTQGHHMPERLFYTVEDRRMSSHQSGHPFYTLRVAGDIEGNASHRILRYQSKYRTDMRRGILHGEEQDVAGCSNATGEACQCGWTRGMNSSHGTCPCPVEAVFQDPTDFVQVGEFMYFLATGDYKAKNDRSPPCHPAWDAQGPTDIFQGAREVYFTRGLPGTDLTSRYTYDPSVATFSITEGSLFGESNYPKLSEEDAVKRVKGLVGMRLFTRAKELTKMRNAQCTGSRICRHNGIELQSEYLLFVSTAYAGDDVEETTATLQSQLRPQLWKVLVGVDGFRADAPRVAAPGVSFPSYVTVLDDGVRAPVAMFLGQNDSLPPAYAPGGGTAGAGRDVLRHEYRVPTRFEVWAYTEDSPGPILVVRAEDDNLSPCQHPQGHPGFVLYRGKVHFLFDLLGTGEPVLYSWDPSTPHVLASPVQLPAGVRPWLPPLNKGYAIPVVLHGVLLIPLAEGTQAAEDDDCPQLPPDACQKCANIATVTGCMQEDEECFWDESTVQCRAHDGVNQNVHMYQRGFACLDRYRGNVTLWALDAEGKVTKVGGDGRDPVWLRVTDDRRGVFWVGHPTGMTNTGMRLRQGRFAGREEQALYLTTWSTREEGLVTTPVWEPKAPVAMYGFTEYQRRMLFWAFDPSPLRDFYDKGNATEANQCYPPGRPQTVQFLSAAGEWTRINVTTGVNVPAFHGCPRVMYSVSVDTPGDPPRVEVEGSHEDGTGVPHSHCCEHSESDGDGVVQVIAVNCTGEECNTLHTRLAKGCLDCSKEGGFPHPRSTPYQAGRYSVKSLWSKPHSGWWFYGFHNLWTDRRTCAAPQGGRCSFTHPVPQNSGRNCSSYQGDVVPCPAAPCTDFTYLGKCPLEETPLELYRPGGFAWREGWPSIMAVYRQNAPVERDDCDDCLAYHFGPTCQSSCPVPPPSTCQADSEDQCPRGKCQWVSGACRPVPCSGYPCFDGIYGNGTCACPGGGTCEAAPEVASTALASPPPNSPVPPSPSPRERELAPVAVPASVEIDLFNTALLHAMSLTAGPAPQRAADVLTPPVSGFVVVKTLGFTEGDGVGLTVTSVGWGRYNTSGERPVCMRDDELGHWDGEFCVDCAFGYSGEGCAERFNCSVHGPCVRGYCGARGGVCECEPGWYGELCDIECSCNHGECTPSGVCKCHSNSTTGYWEGAQCDRCRDGYYGSGCTSRCACKYGVCNRTSGVCDTCLAVNYEGPLCDRCSASYHPPFCLVKCDESSNCRNGRCVQGRCECNPGFYPTLDQSAGCAARCDETICARKDNCPPPGAIIPDPLLPCVCNNTPATGFYSRESNCTLCLDSADGHFEGPGCVRCQRGFYGPTCSESTSATLPPSLSVPLTFRSPISTPKMQLAEASGSLLRLLAESPSAPLKPSTALSLAEGERLLLSESAREVVLIAAGSRREDSSVLGVELWETAYSKDINYTSAYRGRFSVHTTARIGNETKVVGQSVVGMFAHGDFVYFVVNDTSRPYVARAWASRELPPHQHPHGLTYLTSDGHPLNSSRSCADQDCAPGTLVVSGALKGTIVETRPDWLQVVLTDGSGAMWKAVDATPVSSVAFFGSQPLEKGLGLEAKRHARYELAGWGHDGEMVFAVMRESEWDSREGRLTFATHLLQTITLHRNLTRRQPIALVTFSRRHAVTGLFVHALSHYRMVFVVGVGLNGDHVLQRWHQSGIGEPVRVVDIMPRTCREYRCVKLERVVAVNTTRGLLLARVLVGQDEIIMAQRLAFTDVKGPAKGHRCNATLQREDCESHESCAFLSGRCSSTALLPLRVDLPKTSRVVAVVVDASFGFMYLTVGVQGAPSSVYKVATATLQTNLTRHLAFTPTAAPEDVVGVDLDAPRRAVFMAYSTEQSDFGVMNTYDVTYLTPDVADGPQGGTNVTVFAAGLYPASMSTAVDSIYTPTCRMGAGVESNGSFSRRGDGMIIITCPTVVPQAYSPCDTVPLEVSLGGSARFSASAVGIKRIDTPLMLYSATSRECWNPQWVLNASQASGSRPVVHSTNPACASLPLDPPDTPSLTELHHPPLLNGLAEKVSSRGPSGTDVAITVRGAGFVDTPYIKCRLGGRVVPATFISPVRMLCLQPAATPPGRYPLSVSMDGQQYSAEIVHGVTGPPVKLVACFGSSKCTTRVEEMSRATVPYPPITAYLLDANGVPTGITQQTPYSMTVKVSPSLQHEGLVAEAAVVEGVAQFPSATLIAPQAVRYTVHLTYPDVEGAQLEFVVEGGLPTELRFRRRPPKYSNNRTPLTIQPELTLHDAAGNLVNSSRYMVHASLDRVHPGLVVGGIPVISLEGNLGTSSGHSTYRFTNLQVLEVRNEVKGHALKYTEDEELKEFHVVFYAAKDGEKLRDVNEVEHTMHMVDCSGVGHDRVAWVEPEELPVGSNTPISVRGWEYHEPLLGGTYKCVFHDPDGGMVESVEAVFEDSCTLRCLPSYGARATPKMMRVRPVFCCGECLHEGVSGTGACGIEEWNETALAATVYHRYVGHPQNLAVWNMMMPLPSPVPGFSPYVKASDVQTDASQYSAPDTRMSLGVRMLRDGLTPHARRDRADYTYHLMMYSSMHIHEMSVLRAAEAVPFAAEKLWAGRDWEHKFEGKEGYPSFRLRVGYTDGAEGILKWRGNWVGYHDTKPRTVSVTVVPNDTRVGTLTSSYASFKGLKHTEVPVLVVNGVPTSRNSYAADMLYSFVEFPDLALRYPAKGVYQLHINAGLVQATRYFRVSEGYPHRAVVDSEAFAFLGGRAGTPTDTQDSATPLAVQPRFRLLDVADNTVTDFPTVHDVRVQVRKVTPWPRCVNLTAVPRLLLDTPGNYGNPPGEHSICYWLTPPPSNTSDEARRLRDVYDPRFDPTGVASYEGEHPLFIWGRPGESYTVFFSFYGEGLDKHGYRLPDLSIGGIKAVQCPASCTGSYVCHLDPPAIQASERGRNPQITIFGDYYSLSQDPEGIGRVRVRLTSKGLEGNPCVVGPPAVAYRDSCSITLDYAAAVASCDASHAAVGRLHQLSTSSFSSEIDISVSLNMGVDFAKRGGRVFRMLGEPAAYGVLPGTQPVSLASSLALTPLTITVTTLDRSGNPLVGADNTTRRLSAIIRETGGAGWTDRDLTTCTSRGCREYPPDEAEAVVNMEEGNLTLTFTLRAPRATTYQIQVKDIPPCPGQCLSGEYVDVYRFNVKVGTPHKLEWGVASTVLIDNSALDQVEYILSVLDSAGNTIAADEARTPSGSPLRIHSYFTIEVPQLSGNTSESKTLLRRRGEPITPENIRALTLKACSIKVGGAGVDPVTLRSPSVELRDIIRYPILPFKIWHGFSCVLTFAATTPDTSPGAVSLIKEINANTNLNVSVQPRKCDSNHFAYSFEFGCWNQRLRRLVDESLPDHVDYEYNPYLCLTECARCKPGAVCDGSVLFGAAAGHWREPVTYKAWECKADNCIGVSTSGNLSYGTPGALGPMGWTTANDRARADNQCKKGTKGPLCGVCDRSSSEEAPYGYARSEDSCSPCGTPLVNMVLLVVISMAFIVVVVVIVYANLQTGPVVKDNPIISVMIRMLLNHIQVSALASGFKVKWSDLLQDFFVFQTKSGETSELLSVDCVAELNYYTKFTGWMVLPGILAIVPGAIVLLMRLSRHASFKGKDEKDVPPAIECSSPYHYLYDWQLDERDKEALGRHIEVCSVPGSGKTLKLKTQRAWRSPLVKCNLPAVATQIYREDTDPYTGETKERWTADLNIGEYGCGLCRRCCMLERLYPTEGVGVIDGDEYECTIDSHQVTLRRLRLFFKGDLLEAAESRLELRDAIAELKSKGQPITEKAMKKLLSQLFLRGTKRSQREKREAMLLVRNMEETGYSSDDEDERTKVKDMLDMRDLLQGMQRQKFALAKYPPWPVKAHKGFLSTLPKTVPLFVPQLDGPDLSLVHLYHRAVEMITKPQGQSTDVGNKVDEDMMRATRVKTQGADSMWKLMKTDPVTGEDREWFSCTDPLTPPSTPPSNGFLALEPLKKTKGASDVGLPEWMMRAEFRGIEPRAAVEKELGGKVALVPLPTDGTERQILVSMHDIAQHVSYNDLYAMARLRRTRDKFQYWKRRGVPEEHIKKVLSDHTTLEEGQPIVAALMDVIDASFRTKKSNEKDGETEISRDDFTIGEDDDGNGVHKVTFKDDEDEESEGAGGQVLREYAEWLRVKMADESLQVLYDCALCNQDFAVLYCPHDDEYYCEACDKVLHQHGEKARHLRLKPQPRTSPLHEAGYSTSIPLRKIYTVAVLVMVFLVYPSLMREVALMLNCTEEICIDLDTCHRYLDRNPEVDCSVYPYRQFEVASFILFVVYGFGIPLLGYVFLRKNRHQLKSKEVLGTLGFLYTGFREKRYYWEMVIMVRKMLVVFIVVFLSRTPRYQLYAAIWTISFFVFLNISMAPFKFRVLWKLENFSLISILITLNIGLLYLDGLGKEFDTLLTLGVFSLNVVVLAVFMWFIVQEAKSEIFELIDENGDGDLTCTELTDFLQSEWDEAKPAFCRNQSEEQEMEIKKRWMAALQRGALADEYYAWKYGPSGPDPRKSRLEWVFEHSAAKELEDPSATRPDAKQTFTESTARAVEEMAEWWKVSYGEARSSGEGHI